MSTSLERGITQSAAGDVHDLGDFTRYVTEDNAELIEEAGLYPNGLSGEIAERYARTLLGNLAAELKKAEAERDAAAHLLDLYAGTIFSALSKPGFEGGHALAVTNLGPYLGTRQAAGK